jgi:hypothetical protein
VATSWRKGLDEKGEKRRRRIWLVERR